MNHLKFTALIFCAAATISVASCNNNKTEPATTTTTETNRMDSSTSPGTTTTKTSTIDTTPQKLMIVKHRVANYTKWQPAYEAHDSMRLANGIHNFVIGRGATDSNMVMVAVKVDDMAKAKTFSKNANFKQAMQKSGVVGTPSFMFITMTYYDSARLNSDLRTMNMFTVKDWDTWKRVFESNKQMRMQNGLVDRAYGYDADDKHKVMLVMAISDTAKARAFMNSDVVKQNRTAGGVVGNPQMFQYRVVKKY